MPREEETTFMVDEEGNEGSSNGGNSGGGSPVVVGLEEKLAALGKTVVFFDYDDTLLASSHLSSQGYSLDSTKAFSREMDEELRALEALVIKTLEAALRISEVYIVTNAETGWVQLSAKKFMPGLLPVLEKLTVISARSTFEKIHGNNPLKWKFCAFQDALNHAYGSMDTVARKNILSFGDSHVEREAVRAATRGYENVRMKSIKFQERPTMEQLRRQLLLIEGTFNYLCTHDGDLDLQLTVFPLEEPERERVSDASVDAASSASSPSSPVDGKTTAAGVPALAVDSVAASVASGGLVYPSDLFSFPPSSSAADADADAQEQQEEHDGEVDGGPAFHFEDDVKDAAMLPKPMEEALVLDG